jgi:putative DNA primase/helicase
MHEKSGDFGDVKVEERWCPREVVNAVRDRGHWPGIRLLAGVTSAPVLRADLTILEQPGYDTAAALLYAPSREYPRVPEAPSTDDVTRALDVLRAPFAEFPFVAAEDRAALLAYLLTLAARPAIRGPVPMTGISARVPGTGKTLLVDSATWAMTGHLPDKLMVPGGRSSDADAEWRKRIATLALEGPRAVLIDNVPDGAMLQSSALAAALTAQELTERLLATNRTVRVPHRIVWTFSGNNVTVAADLARRCLSIDLDAKVEDPHLRSTFRFGNLLLHVRDEHPRLLTAALTLLRGFAVAGCPKHGLPALGMFEAWDALIRSCVIWATGVDPLDTQDRLRGGNPETGNLGRC